ncbi:lysine-specific demethylase JMJ703 [Oryza brachyantha]|uniref:JmjC domain-containing protein n=1 Tax=Oryza brachyantha TaxID=4533 RepID=J3M4P6_ORYBR|nr:lysine-specific demethylase JMJ703 [Oryza brachyantha]
MMGTECITATLNEDNEPSIPPGFGPFAALPLWEIHTDAKPADTHSTSVQAIQGIRTESEEFQSSSAASRSDTPCSTSVSQTCRKSLRNRPPIDYSRFEHISDEDSDVEIVEKDVSSTRRRQLPKGVLRGCAECSDCQKVIAKWNPAGARRPVLDEAPVFYPTEEEFEDTLKYIESIRPMAEPYGICRIVPPSSWKPPCLLKDKSIWEGSKFSTRVQKVDKLQNRKSSKKSKRGGMMKRRKLSKPEEDSAIGDTQIGMQQNPERFGFEPGPEFTLQTFQKYADDFSKQYFRKDTSMDSVPSVEEIEGEYWRIVERPTEEIEVIYGADLETGTFSSGFPKLSPETKSDVEDKYAQSGWNLNNLPRLQGSVLSFEGGDISGVLVPWVYVGMCFSSFCWHVEDHHLYSLNYMHWGAPKMWYGVPGKDAVNLESSMRKHLPDLFEEQPDLLHNLVTQFSPSLLKSEGVQVYRCVQHEGEFVLTFPRAYHAGFNCGFNCAEAVNVAPIDWLPIGQNAVELYREQARKITISHDKLLLGAAREAIRAQWDILFLKRNTADNVRWKSICGADSTICKALKARIETELAQRKTLSFTSQSRKMDAEFDSIDRECALCYYDLHLSASGCSCCPEKYACLAHVKQLCSCDWEKRFFLFRYDVNELNILADALGGKLSAIHRWGVSDLGLSLSSCVKREKVQDSKTVRRITDGPRRSYMSQASAVSLVPSFACNEQKDEGNKITEIASPQTINVCPSAEEMKSENISTLKEPGVRNELPCTANSDTNSLQYNGGHGGHQGSAPGLSVSSSQSFPSNGTARLFSTSSASMKIVQGLVASKGCIQPSSRTGDGRPLLGGLQNRSTTTIHDGTSMKSSLESSNSSHRLMASDYNAHCHSSRDQVSVTPGTNASVMTLKDGSQVHTVSSQQFVRTGPWTQSASHGTSPSASAPKPFIDLPAVKDPYGGFTQGNAHLGPPCSGNQQPNDGRFQRTSEPLPGVEARARGHPTVMAQPALEIHGRNGGAQKGPRVANVVRRFKCSVEPLEIGVVLSGRGWSSSQAIFPKGFRSRVKYFSIVDPIQMAYYISEILDAGMQGPLFMVTLENCPGEVFINLSPTKCWNMVRERLNMEIRRQLNMERQNLPALQPPGSIDGIEMFGLLSPPIVQAIEARDRDRVCTEYWRSRPHAVIEDPNNRHMLPQVPSHLALRGLIQRANRDELQVLRSLMMNNNNMDDNSRQQAAHMIEEEIAKQWN